MSEALWTEARCRNPRGETGRRCPAPGCGGRGPSSRRGLPELRLGPRSPGRGPPGGSFLAEAAIGDPGAPRVACNGEQEDGGGGTAGAGRGGEAARSQQRRPGPPGGAERRYKAAPRPPGGATDSAWGAAGPGRAVSAEGCPGAALRLGPAGQGGLGHPRGGRSRSAAGASGPCPPGVPQPTVPAGL